MKPAFIVQYPYDENMGSNTPVNLNNCISIRTESDLSNRQKVYFIIFTCLNNVTVKWKFNHVTDRDEIMAKIRSLNCFLEL